MKKWLIRIVIVLVVLAVLSVVAVGLFLDSGIKRGIETVGPMLTKTSVKLDGVSLSILSGSGKIKGLVVGNPEGYKTPSAIQVGSASLQVQPGSLFGDKVVVKSIRIDGPEITYETNLKQSNLGKLVSNLQEVGGSSQAAGSKTVASGAGEPNAKAEKKAEKKLEVDEFVISGAKVNVSVTALGGKSMTVPLPEIRLSNLGTGPEGITVVELTKLVLQEVEKGAAQAASTSVADLSKQANAITKDLGDTTKAAESVTKSIGNLFKKK